MIHEKEAAIAFNWIDWLFRMEKCNGLAHFTLDRRHFRRMISYG